MTIATRLNDDSGGRSTRSQIVSHHAGESAEERKCGFFHPRIANRDEVGEASFVRLLKADYRIGAPLSGRPAAAQTSRDLFSERLSFVTALVYETTGFRSSALRGGNLIPSARCNSFNILTLNQVRSNSNHFNPCRAEYGN